LRILAICDLHYDKRVFGGFDEGRAWEWLLSIVDYHSPEYLLSCGDWGEAVNEAEFYMLLRRAIVLTIYGNHEKMDVLSKLYNVRSNSYLPVLMEDGRIYDVGDLRVAGINGLIAKERKHREGVPRKAPEEFLEIAGRVAGSGVDVLLIHETPYLLSLFPFMEEGLGSRTSLKAVEMIKPRLVINGHMHSGGFKTHEFPWGSRYIYIDSSQQNRHYLVMRSGESSIEVEVWRDLEKITTMLVEKQSRPRAKPVEA
jgi:Icc-related predicted phosphoesterase